MMSENKRKSRPVSTTSNDIANNEKKKKQFERKTMMMVNFKRTRADTDTNAMNYVNVRPNWKSRINAVPNFSKTVAHHDPLMLHLEESLRTVMSLKEKNEAENLDEQAKPMDNSKNSQDIKNNTIPMRSLNRHYTILVFLIVLSLLIGVLSILLYHRKSMHREDYVNAAVELKKRIYGQPFVNTLSEYLLQDKPSLKVIALLGSTGVGKSYAVNIIKENFPRPYFITQLYPPIKLRDAKFNFYPHLLIMENLRKRDAVDVVRYLKKFQKDVHDRNVTVLTIFNFEQIDNNGNRIKDINKEVPMLQSYFDYGHIDAKIIPYVSLDEKTIEKCIADVINYNGQEVSDEQINDAKRYLLHRDTGCKGALSAFPFRT